jgi:4'-phosphopantetheinyl transferase
VIPDRLATEVVAGMQGRWSMVGNPFNSKRGSKVCVVWLARLGMLRDTHAGLLDPSETGRRSRYAREHDRVRFALGAVLLRLAAARELGVAAAEVRVDRSCEQCGEPHGKTRLPGTALFASVSHSEQVVGIAMTCVADVGLDVEAVGSAPIDESLRDACLAPEEPLRGRDDFFTYWCRKESVVKATGDGLRVPLTQVRVSAADEQARLLSYAGTTLAATVSDIDIGVGYRGAVTVLTGDADSLALEVRDAGELLA